MIYTVISWNGAQIDFRKTIQMIKLIQRDLSPEFIKYNVEANLLEERNTRVHRIGRGDYRQIKIFTLDFDWPETSNPNIYQLPYDNK